jgi:glycosyltransferase involved in cell wall biosynthesis
MREYPALLLELARHPRVRFIAVSHAIRQCAIAFGIPEDKLSVHYIGVDPRKFTPNGLPVTRRERRVLFVGRLVEKKGCEYLLRAFAQTQVAVPDASLIVVGAGPLLGPLRQLAGQLRVRAEFRGALSSREVQKELSLARAFCLPSIIAANGDAEGLGMALLEAQASGVPVVTSAAGGAEEGIENGRTGFRFREKDIVALAGHLTTLLTDDATASAMAAAGPRFVADKFDCLQCTKALESHYDVTIEE